MVHVADEFRQGFHKIIVWTVDTGVVVLAVVTVQQLGSIDLWIAFGSGKNFHYIPAHEISAFLDTSGLPRLHGL